MRFTKEKLAEYPPQDEKQLLVEFTTEYLARRHYEINAHPGTSWTGWVDGGSQDDRESRLEPFREIAEHLHKSGMLNWPETTTADPAIGWQVEGPGQTRGPKAAPELDWIKLFGRSTSGALNYFRACAATKVPCRIRWAFRESKG